MPRGLRRGRHRRRYSFQRSRQLALESLSILFRYCARFRFAKLASMPTASCGGKRDIERSGLPERGTLENAENQRDDEMARRQCSFTRNRLRYTVILMSLSHWRTR
jgi:hypothetical protein